MSRQFTMAMGLHKWVCGFFLWILLCMNVVWFQKLCNVMVQEIHNMLGIEAKTKEKKQS